jgi:hypothetical protein
MDRMAKFGSQDRARICELNSPCQILMEKEKFRTFGLFLPAALPFIITFHSAKKSSQSKAQKEEGGDDNVRMGTNSCISAGIETNKKVRLRHQCQKRRRTRRKEAQRC